jgi:hypothetical protein
MRKVTLTLFNKTVVESIPIGREYLIIAKKVETDNIAQFYVRFINNSPVSPVENTIYELKKNDGTFIKVSESVYSMYIDIINGKSRVSLNSIERLSNV